VSLPDNALVGFISYGTQVHVHELGFSEMNKVYIFRGSKEVSKDQVLDHLGLGRRAQPGYPKGAGQQPGVVQNGVGVFPNSGVNRFLLPASDCEYTLNAVSFLFFNVFFWVFIDQFWVVNMGLFLLGGFCNAGAMIGFWRWGIYRKMLNFS